MSLLLHVLAIALCPALALSTPIENLIAGGKFTLEQTAVQAEFPRSLPHAIRRDYLRYGAEVPAELQEAVEAHTRWINGNLSTEAGEPGTTSVEVKPGRHDIQYLMNIQVGKHTMSVDLDTGSSDLWVISDLLPAGGRGNRPVNKLYDTKGGGSRLEGHSWRIAYGDRSTAGGQVYIDKVTIGELSVDKQAVEAASTMSSTFLRDGSRDGLLGLGFAKGNMIRPKQQPTWFDNVKSQLKEPLFTCSLKRAAKGTYDFGYIDTAKYQGEIAWAPVKGAKSHWDFNMTGFAIGNGPVKERRVYGIADTGSSLWYMPDEIVDAYWKQVPGATFSSAGGGWSFPCGAKLPNFTVVVGGKKIVVDGINLDYTQTGRMCMGGMQRDLKGVGFSLFGDTFLKGLFVVFEAAKGKEPRLGFAKSA